MPYFEYGDLEINALKKKDKRLAEAIDRIGFIKREVIPDIFAAIVNSIIAQQISTKAAESIWIRICEKYAPIIPETISQIDADELKTVGISRRKAENIKKIADSILNNSLDLEELMKLSDDEVIAKLCALDGIGTWTAEMIMIFSMQRKNILSCNDFGIRRGIMMLYHHKTLDNKRFERYKKRYSPYGSIASLYLWEIAKGK